MKLTYYGQSCFAVEMGGKNLLFDPFIRPNELAGHITVEDIKADYILVEEWMALVHFTVPKSNSFLPPWFMG